MCACACLYVYKIIKIIFFIACMCVCLSQTHFILLQQQQQQQQQFLYLYFFGKGTKRKEKEETNGYGHTKRKAPLLARSVKLSLFGLGQYQGWRQPGNSECCNLFVFLFFCFVICYSSFCANVCECMQRRKRKGGWDVHRPFIFFTFQK